MPIDIASGNVHGEYPELRVPGKVELIWDRRFSNALLGRSPGWWGPGWTNRYLMTLTRHAGGFEFFGPDGAVTLLPDGHGAVEAGKVACDLRSNLEIFMRDAHYIVQQWSAESSDVWRYVFRPQAGNQCMPLIAIENLGGDGLDLQRDTHGRLVAVRQRREGRQLLLTHAASGRLESVALRGPRGDVHPVARYEYDSQDRLSLALDALDQADAYSYGGDGRLVRESARHGGVASYRYDETGRCVWMSGVNHYDEKHLRFLDATRITELTDSRGATYRYQWLANGQIIGEWNPLGAHTATEYDAFGRIIARTSPIGATTRYEYDNRGNRSAIVNPNGSAYRIQFNDWHQPTAVTDPDGQMWLREYDDWHRLIASIDPLGGRWTVAYDALGDVVALTNPRQQTRQFGHEGGILCRASDWMGQYTAVEHDTFGRLLRRVDPLGHAWRYRYDPVGNLAEVELPDGGKLHATYSPAGDVVRVIDAEGRTTLRRYGPCRRLAQTVDARGGTVSYHWGTEPGQLESVINERGEAYRFTYDEAGRCIEEAGFDGRRLQFRYDMAGRCIATINGAGETVEIRRDMTGAIVEQKLPNGESVRYAYDRQGRLSAAVNTDCEVRFERDAMGRLVRERQGDHWVSYALDALGATTQLQTSLGLRLDYELDANGLWSGLLTHTGAVFRFTRDARGQEVRRDLPVPARLTQRHDSVGRITLQQVHDAPMAGMPGASTGPWEATPGAARVERSYRRDRSGWVTGIDTSLARHTAYAFDPAEHLLGLLQETGTSEQFEYDETGNLMRIQREGEGGHVDHLLQYGPGNVLVSKGGCRYEHDAQGRLVRKVEDADSERPRVWTYQWNALDQLRSVTRPDGEVWRYLYDPFSRRIAKCSESEEVRFVWSGHVPVHEIASNGKDPVAHVFAQDSFDPIAQIRGGKTYPVITDHLGTPREMLDPAGRIVWKAATTAFGEPTTMAPASGISCSWHFPGQWFDIESGLYYSRYRYYDPGCARFISPDPIRLLGGNNQYVYAPNPVNWIDPWGLICQRLAGTLPEGPGIYHIELNGQIYTGSGVNVRSRLSAADHPAAALLADPNVRVTVFPVNLGNAAGNQRMTNHILRGYEQGVMDHPSIANTPQQNGSLNQIRAAKATRTAEYAQDATNNGASATPVGSGTVY